ncbi:hypothetical protein KUTeg_001773 [Tegillarca granosa]|uniref:Cyclin-like domain-containing protein n=1 Tax=Tegillarca granosa TaxID=220873 RepID=A0ABQ9FVK9_TEGGR|nr:hypothetical protein KUTeg_001773 [Tegillarca granosa]
MADTKQHPTLPRDFSKVILTLDNVLIPEDKLSPTPSLQDGLDSETEMDLRIIGCELIQTAGILLKLPQVAMATGQVLFQRFYYSKSFVKHNMEVVAMACINLASKIEESPRRLRDVINVFHHIKQLKYQKVIHPLVLDQNYINTKNQVIKSERRVLKELGFCVHVKHPHKIIVMFLQVLECEKNAKLVQCAWNYMNDSFRTDVFVKYQPETIACACIYLAARQLKPNYEAIEGKVNEAKKLQIEAKMKAKDSPKNVSPNPSLMASIKSRLEAEKSRHSDNGSLKNHVRKKRSHSPSDRSRSRSTDSSKSASLSPVRKRRKNRAVTPPKYKKDRYSPDRYIVKEHKHSHKRKKRSYSRSRSRSLSPQSDRYSRVNHRKKHYKEKDHYYSPERHHSKRHRNGHRSDSREKYDKYDKYEKYRR